MAAAPPAAQADVVFGRYMQFFCPKFVVAPRPPWRGKFLFFNNTIIIMQAIKIDRKNGSIPY
jgi:hypothetical protein